MMLLVMMAGLVDADAPRVRVFGVGFKKTGTTSFSHACTMLSLREVGLSTKARLLMLEAAVVGRRRPDSDRFFDVVDQFECFQDSPFTNAALVPVLAERYAAAKFVLTVRNATAWVGSALRWIDHERPENPNYGARFWEALGRRDATPPTHREAEALIRSHDADVRNYFASRNESARLLEVDFSAEVDASAFWTRLCAFVGLAGTICPCPPVPRANANGAAARDEFGQPLARRRRRP